MGEFMEDRWERWLDKWVGGAIAESTYTEGKFIIRVRISFQRMLSLPQKGDGYEELK